MLRNVCAMLLVCILTVPTLAATYYAAPGGTGTGKTIGSPTTVAGAIAMCPTGGTVELADGTYVGSAGMIYLLGKVNITVRAAHDGQVWIWGRGETKPVHVDTCRGVTIEGINASASKDTVVDVLHSHDVTIRRVCAWEGQLPRLRRPLEHGNEVRGLCGLGPCTKNLLLLAGLQPDPLRPLLGPLGRLPERRSQAYVRGELQQL